MKCPYCKTNDTRVLESREIQDSTRRRRECNSCEKRFTTYERVEKIDLTVVKKNGDEEPFSREKMRKGMLRALEKRPVTMEQVDKATDSIESNLRKLKSTKIKSEKIGKKVMKKLKKLDEVAYLRFASVYKEFDDAHSFKKELKNLN
ncbi:MAG: transcriptional regulator NrdR [Candidatus Undinarchaeales archaeon]